MRLWSPRSRKLTYLTIGIVLVALVTWAVIGYVFLPPELRALRRIREGTPVRDLSEQFPFQVSVRVDPLSEPLLSSASKSSFQPETFTGTFEIPSEDIEGLQLWDQITCKDGKVTSVSSSLPVKVGQSVRSLWRKLPSETRILVGRPPTSTFDLSKDAASLSDLTGWVSINDVRLVDRFYYEIEVKEGVVRGKRWFHDTF